MVTKPNQADSQDYVVLGHGIPIGRINQSELKVLRTKGRKPSLLVKNMISRLIKIGIYSVIAGTCLAMLSALWMTLDPAGYISFIVSAGFIPFDHQSQKAIALAPYMIGLVGSFCYEGVRMSKRPNALVEQLIAEQFGCSGASLVPERSIQTHGNP